MRSEIQKTKEIVRNAANNARLYHENIARVRRTCKPEHIQQEMKVFQDPLKESMSKAMKEVDEVLGGLSDSMKAAIVIRGEDYDGATMAAISALEPGAEELSEIAKRYEGNETMLRALSQYNIRNKVGAEIPISGQSRLQALDMMRADIRYVIQDSANMSSRYGDSLLQNFAENFDTIFGDRISIIGD